MVPYLICIGDETFQAIKGAQLPAGAGRRITISHLVIRMIETAPRQATKTVLNNLDGAAGQPSFAGSLSTGPIKNAYSDRIITVRYGQVLQGEIKK